MRAAAIFLGCLVVGAPGAAQGVADVARLAENPSVLAALRSIHAAEPATIADQVRRAAAYADAFRAAGLKNVRLDREGNVLGERPGRAVRALATTAAASPSCWRSSARSTPRAWKPPDR